MKIKINTRQFDFLIDNFPLIGHKGPNLKMSGKVFKKIMPVIYPLNEGQKAYKVDMWFGTFKTKMIIFSDSSATAIVLARKMFPKARVYGATEVKGRL
ncbi:hypothetical protein LB450_08530 [Psychroflexus sp. CAK1W]|uniref:hypothetical protein n=1 Tax=Psychroflexus curvus TaxID=2873595 RepID=UPI001CD03D5A|nr:hypothetical protein [Psychroflexus curvus]MBZ9628142.1 hypothetical protein [Psychroflexus curvus]